jgi:glutathione S-transferase
MYFVYGDHKSGNCYKVELALKQLGLPFEWRDIDVLKGESRTAEYLALNPSGQAPLLVTPEGTPLPESNAILHYLADGSPLLPADRMARAQMLRWMFFEQYTHEPNVAVARFIVRYLGRPPEREETLQAKIKGGHAALRTMESHLAKNDFFAAGRYTIADIALYAYTHVAHEGLIELAGYPAIGAWMARVQAQPGYAPMSA